MTCCFQTANKKGDVVLSVHHEVETSAWFKMALQIAEGIDHFHKKA